MRSVMTTGENKNKSKKLAPLRTCGPGGYLEAVKGEHLDGYWDNRIGQI